MTSIVDDTTVDDETQPREHAYFEKADEFLEHLKTLIGVDLFSDEEATEEERNAIRRVQMICGEYHEQSYLWDPWLEQIVGPPIEALRQHAARVVESADKDPATVRANWLAEATYQIVNTRGSKIIVSFFPHQVSDLSVAIAYMQRLEPSGSRGAWAIRYIVLLWLSLICRLPFDLSNFDPEGGESGSTADTIEAIGLQYLDKAGLERDAAALLLARLYARQDTHTRFKNFLDQSEPHLVESPNLFRALGAMQVFTEILKSGGLDQLALHLPQILELAQKLPHNTSLSVHTVIRKYVIKVSGRVGLKLLPHTPTNRITIRTLHGETISPNEGFASSTESEAEIPDEIEGIIDDMLNGLRDRDTTIRWSAAKYIARIGSSVPNDLTSQLLDAILDIYQTHFVEGGELNTAAEPSWHGATLACAEFARQGLISGNNVPKTVNWVLKALFFDVKKGTHSIGSNVRDAACYFLWSLPRTLDPNAMRPYATRLAQSLITLALFDREVHIRRAASAAFQENVGRMGLFPHGIEVLKWIDFYGVGVRRNSFVVSAPEVARHEVYRGHLLNYLVDTTLKHWDPDMRSIGAEALKELCKADIYTLAPPVVERLKGSLAFVDSHEIHGAILGLREIAEGLREEQDGERSTKFRAQIFELLDRLTDSSIKGYKNDLLLEATSQLIGSSLSDIALNARPDLDVKSPPKWRFILDLCLKHRSDVVQDAGSRAVGMLSELRSSERDIDHFISELQTTNSSVQQGMTRVLGFAGSSKYPQGIRKAITCLIGVVKRDGAKKSSSYCVEARRNGYDSMTRLLRNIQPILFEELDHSLFQDILRSFLEGLEDYSVDERGDVGSWIRIACIKGLSGISQLILASQYGRKYEWISMDLYTQIWAGILKQGAERLDNVRAEVGKQIVQLLGLIESLPPADSVWIPEGFQLLKTLFMTEIEVGDGWNESNWLFPRIVQLLQVEAYREHLVRGIIISIGSRNESTNRPASTALTHYLLERQNTAPEERIIEKVLKILLDIAQNNSASNIVVLPILSTFNELIDGGLATEAASSPEGLELLCDLLNFVGVRVERLKNVQRINLSMRITVQLLAVTEVFETAKACLSSFLCHAFPKVREETGEFLYFVLQSQEVPGGDAIEPILLETDWAGPEYASSAQSVIKVLEN